MTGTLPKRFWTQAQAVPEAQGFAVHLDSRPVRTPSKAPLILPNLPLAEAVAAEWQAQGERLDPATMPHTRTANTALDKVAASLDEVVRIVADYGGSDLLCYRASHPQELVDAQSAWDAPLDWAAETLGARLRVTAGVMPVAQDPEALARLDAEVARLSVFELTAFHDLVALSGSLILGLSVAGAVLDPEQAWRLSRVDEEFQARLWGSDAEAEAAAESRRQAFHDAAEFLRLCRL
ncbi:ATP12 family chaperone protein [Frigidibacter sp. ROC022]|uniref:ATP12 family chaperone protein n=1 Tax=Frigidibacter sp. ROC022 TaxID=2971796 RepID=UPI00215A6A8D|nr:ATP12 family protein [Frigidibacter sp. ROC022]MCR8726584.1 ATPase [Frigidibacter sp. ROC022]